MQVPDGQGLDFPNGGISRLEQGLSIVRETVAALPGTRFAISISRNRGIIAIPLTWDNGTALAFLDALDGSAITGIGTNLESLVNASVQAFQSSLPSNRVIILVSDGEELSGSLNKALEHCNQNDIAVTAILTGSDEGGTVPGLEGIVSRANAAVMRKAAAETGGIFIDGNRKDAAETLIAHLRSLSTESESAINRKENKARWLIFIILAIIAFGSSKLCLLKFGKKE
jgi:Ca-activated chloride channel family protein